MNAKELGLQIRSKALEIGFDQCGILKVDELKDYADILAQRTNDYPDAKPLYDVLSKLAFPQKTYDWAKSVIVCVNNYAKYKIPKQLDGIICKYYLFDYKWKNDSKDFKKVENFENFLKDCKIKIFRDPVLGAAPARLCAVKTNLGVIRKNNFFYTKNGSWSWIETWITDADMEFKENKNDIEECPTNCNKCIESCPTKALCKPYSTNMLSCVTRFTYGTRGVTPKPFREKMKTWIYGCDECQNACPKNQGVWKEEEDFSFIDDIVKFTSLEEIVTADEETLKKIFLPKFYFINQERIWVWKCNALIAMANNYKPQYEKYIKNATLSENENIKEVALWAKEKIGL